MATWPTATRRAAFKRKCKILKRGSLTHEAINGIAWQSVSIGANILLRTAILIVLTRTLPARDFGIMAAAMVVISVTTVLSEIGVARVLVQRLELTRGIERSAFAIALYMGVLTTVLIFFSAPLFADIFQMPELVPYVRFLSMVLLINSVSAVVEALTQRERRFKRMGLVDTGSFLVGHGFVALPMAIYGYGVWSLAIGYFVQCALKLFAYWVGRPPQIGLVPREGTRELLFTGVGYMAGQGGNFVARQVDYFFVGRLLGAEALGFYNRAYQFLMLPAQLFGTATAKVLFPSVASIQEDRDRVSRAFLRALGVIAMLTLPATGFLFVIAPELVLTLFGDSWQPMIVPFQILILSLLGRTSYKISDSITLAMGSMRARAWRQWIYAAAVALGAWGGAQAGLAGVAAGVSLAVMLNFAIMTKLAISITGVSTRKVIMSHLRHAIIAVVYSAIIYFAVSMARAGIWSDLEILCSATLLALLLAAILWFGARPVFGEDGEWFSSLLRNRLPFLRKTA